MKNFFIWSLGCQMNKSDAERISSVLEKAGLTKSESESQADVIITMACSVRQTAIDRIHGKTKEWKKIKASRPLITILSGCVLKSDRKKLENHFDLIVETSNVREMTDFLKLTFDKGSIKSFFSIHPSYESNFQAYVPISTGCNNFCTYCAVPYTRGREVSRPENEILKEVRELANKGYREITLLGQNVNSYGNDFAKKDTNFVQLIKKIDQITENFRVYFYSNHPKDMSDELIETMAGLKHFPHYIHLPLQSGSDKIIKVMNRHYTQEKYLKIIKKIRKEMPDASITTDIIVGFPGETEEDFAQTKYVLEKSEYSMPFIAKYSPRSGTVSAKMEDNISNDIKERRFRELTKAQEEVLTRQNKKLVGTKQRVLVDSCKKGKYYGRTDSYKVVEITNIKTDLIGRFCEVEIFDPGAWLLKGRLTKPILEKN